MKIKINTHGNKLPQILPNGDWIDLAAADDLELCAGEYGYINFGISMELPEGYEAVIMPRSSTFKKWGLIQTNSVGLIDNSYCGDGDIWMMPVLAMRNTRVYRGDRVAQFRIQKKMEPVEFEVVDALNNADRGGFGSTGRN